MRLKLQNNQRDRVVEFEVLVRGLMFRAIHRFDIEETIERFLEIAEVQRNLNGSSDFIAACNDLRQKLIMSAAVLDGNLAAVVERYFGFHCLPVLGGKCLKSVNQLCFNQGSHEQS